MTFITTTQLRTMTKDLVAQLSRGETVQLIHRSKVIGQIMPSASKEVSEDKKFNAKEFRKASKALGLKPMSDTEKDAAYRKAMMSKHG